MTMRVVRLAVYPTHGEPGVDLAMASVEADGLAGDRRKKAAVHLIEAADAAVEDPPRANVVLDTMGEHLVDLVGQRLRLGTATLAVTKRPSNCPGVYADVVEPGEVSVGDEAATAGG